MITFHRQGFGTFTARRGIGPCVWPHFDLLAIHRGEVAIALLGGEELRVPARRAILIYPQTPFVGRALGASARASVQHFALGADDAGPMPAVLARLRGRRRGFVVLGSGWSRDVERDLARAVAIGDPGSDPDATDQRVALLALTLSALRPGPSVGVRGIAPPPALEGLVDWLRLRLGRDTPLAEMAERASLSPNRFIEVFRRHYASTPARFLLVMRMHEAQRLLAETAMPIKEVALTVGYPQVPHFYRAFTAYVRTTPKAYRDRNALRG